MMDSSPKRVGEREKAPAANNTVLTSAAMWLAGTRSSGGGNSVSSLDASEVLDSATQWLAAEGVNDTNAFPSEAPKRTSTSPRARTKRRYMYDAPPAPETSMRGPSESTPNFTNDKTTRTAHRVPGSPVRSRVLVSERHPFAPIPETAPPPPPPPRPEQTRRSETTEHHTTDTANGSPRSRRKRGRDTSSISIMEGVEGLGQRLKRVCLKAKFHRRARHHVSSEDLTMIGTTEVMPAPITPPDNKRDAVVYNTPPVAKKATSSRSLISGGISTDQEHAAFISATSHSLVTGIVDTRNEKVETQTPTDKRNQPAAAAAQSAVRSMPHQTNIFLQPKGSTGRGVLDDLESDHGDILFTESTTSDEGEYAA